MTISRTVYNQLFQTTGGSGGTAADEPRSQIIRLEPSAKLGSDSEGSAAPQTRSNKVQLWTSEEHDRFLHALQMYPEGPWKKIAEHIGTKTPRQTMTHAQKYRQKIMRRQRGLQRQRRAQQHQVEQTELPQRPCYGSATAAASALPSTQLPYWSSGSYQAPVTTTQHLSQAKYVTEPRYHHPPSASVPAPVQTQAPVYGTPVVHERYHPPTMPCTGSGGPGYYVKTEKPPSFNLRQQQHEMVNQAAAERAYYLNRQTTAPVYPEPQVEAPRVAPIGRGSSLPPLSQVLRQSVASGSSASSVSGRPPPSLPMELSSRLY